MGIALITGASAGLGHEFARLFAQDGHSLILVARRKDRLEDVAKELQKPGVNIWPIVQDLGVEGSGARLFAQVEKLGLKVEFLVNNAGFGSGGAFAGLPLARELEMIDLNVRSLVELTHLFLPQMLERRSGRILNVGSTAGFQPGPFMATYYASKAFVNSFSEALHAELLDTGVTCTVLAPGATATEFAEVSGRKKSALFNKVPVATAASVAREGYKAMMGGRSLLVTGLLNKLMVQSLRVSPRVLVRMVAAHMNQG